MKFKINNTEYEIIEKEQLKNEEDVGYTNYQEKQIVLKKLDKSFMIRTLKHELTHVWLFEYGHNQDEKEFNYEDVCEIVASSNEFINEVVKQYKANQKEEWHNDIDKIVEETKRQAVMFLNEH